MRPEPIDFPDEMPIKAFVRYVKQYPYHWHDTMEILHVLKGSVNIGLGDENLLLKENDIAVINIGELHYMTKSHEDNEILFMHIDARFCRSILPDDRYSFIYCCSPYHEAETPEKYKKLREYMSRLICALNNNPLAYKKDIENVLTSMLHHLTYYFDFLRWGYGITPFDEKRVARLKQIAEQTKNNQEVILGLRELAEEANVSLYYLSHDIKNKFGLTFQELLYYSRCEHAAKLLLITSDRVINIALACGFSDAKYLIKHFKQHFHCNPSEFRKKYRADAKALASQVIYIDYPLSRGIKD